MWSEKRLISDFWKNDQAFVFLGPLAYCNDMTTDDRHKAWTVDRPKYRIILKISLKKVLLYFLGPSSPLLIQSVQFFNQMNHKSLTWGINFLVIPILCTQKKTNKKYPESGIFLWIGSCCVLCVIYFV